MYAHLRGPRGEGGASAELSGGSQGERTVSSTIAISCGLNIPLTSVKTQANLILSARTSVTPANLLTALPALMQELVGFFIIESHILRTMPDFRTRYDVDELWDEMCKRIVGIMGQGLKGCEKPEVFLESKGNVLLFVQTLEVCQLYARFPVELKSLRGTDTKWTH